MRPAARTLCLLPCLLVFATAAAFAQVEPPRPKPEEVTIDFVGSNVVVQGKALTIPCELDEVTQLLGPGDRVTKLFNWITTWDELGVIAYCKPETTQVISIAVCIAKKDFKFAPKKTFVGFTSVDGADITPPTTVAKINVAKKGAKLTFDIPGLPASIKYPAALITVGEEKQNGKVVGIDSVAISWREPKKKPAP